MVDKLLESLVAAGPLALILGFAVKTLWSTLNEERQKHATEVAATEARHDAEVTQLRAEAAADRQRLEAKLSAIQAEYVGTLKTLANALRDTDSNGG